MKKLLYILILLFAFNQVNGQEVRRVKEASKMTSITDTTSVDKTAGKMYVYDSKYWVGDGTYLVQFAAGSAVASVSKDIVTTAPITGGEDDVLPGLDADLTIAMPVATTSADGYLDKDDWNAFTAKMNDLVDDTSPSLAADLDGEGYYAVGLQNIPDLSASGAGLWFDGTDDKVTVADDADVDFGISDFTLLAKFNTNKVSGWQSVIDKRYSPGPTQQGYSMSLLNADMKLIIGDGTTLIEGSVGVTLTINTNYIVGFVYDQVGGNGYTYINGSLENTIDISTVTGTVTTNQDLYFGYTSLGGNYFSGTINEVLAFNLALDNTDADDKAIINGGDIPYKYLGGSNAIIATYDSSAVDDTDITLVAGKHYTWTVGNADSLMLNLVKATSDTTFVFDGTSDVRAKGDLTFSNLQHTGCVFQGEPDAITPTTWYEPNGLNGTISGAVVTNPLINVYGSTYGSDGSVTDAELLYINTLSLNAQDQIDALAPEYAEMYITGGGATTVDVASTDHPLTDFIEGLSCTHWGFHAHTTGEVTVWSTAAGGDSTNCYDATHGLSDDDVVYITGTTTADYDGIFVIDVIDVDNFRIGKTFTSDQADNAWTHPDHLTTLTGAEGIYMVSWNLSFTSANNSDVFEASIYVNATRQVKSVRTHKSKTAGDIETVSGHCLIDFSIGDEIHLAMRNNTGANNFTVVQGIFIVNNM